MPKRTEISAFHHTLKVLKDWSKLSSNSFRGQKLHKNRPRKKNWNKYPLRNSESIFWFFWISKAGRFQNNYSRELLKSKRSLRKLLKNTRGKAKIETSGEKADREDSKQEEGQEGWQVETQPETIRDEADTSSKSKKGKKEDKKRDKKPKKQPERGCEKRICVGKHWQSYPRKYPVPLFFKPVLNSEYVTKFHRVCP